MGPAKRTLARHCRIGFAYGMISLMVASSAAHAQTRNPTDNTFSAVSNQLQGKKSRNIGALGYEVAPGVIVTPRGYTSGGYDTNPNDLFVGPSSAFAQTGLGLDFSVLDEDSVIVGGIDGTWLHYDNLERGDRYQGRAALNGSQRLAPGISVSGGVLYEYDGLDFIKEEVYGGYAELSIEQEQYVSYFRTRATEIKFLNDGFPAVGVPVAQLPLFRTSAFDMRRFDVESGLMVFTGTAVSPYIEGGISEVDYINQNATAFVDRDGLDLFAKAGIRVVFAPELVADMGWRWNHRDLRDDPTIGSHFGSYFDGSLTWTPSQYFNFKATVERTNAEPIGAFGVVADRKTYLFASGYRPFDRVNLTASGSREYLQDIGGDLFFKINRVQGEATYQSASWAQFYANVVYEHVEEDTSDDDYERVTYGAGLRVALGSGAGGPDDPFVLPFTQPATWHSPKGDVILDIGPSWFYGPEVFMTTVIGGTFFDEALFQLEEHDGELSGGRGELTFKDVARYAFGDSGDELHFSVSAFYGYYQSKGSSACDFTATTDCAMVNIDDFDQTDENNTGAFGQLRTSTDRSFDYWGAAVSARLFGPLSSVAGLSSPMYLRGGKGFSPMKTYEPSVYSPFKVGANVRGLHERTKVFMVDISVPDPVDYKQDVDSYYYGAFVGFEHAFNLGSNWSFSVDTNAGLYYTHATYEGRYVGFIPIGGTNFVIERGALDVSDDTGSFIGDIKLSLDRKWDWGSIGIFGEAEYLSHVASIDINNNDEAGGSPFGVVGTQVGTELDWEEAWNWTVGLRARIDLNDDY